MLRLLLLSLLLLAGPSAAQSGITDAAARAFVARQEQAWNAGDMDAYFAGFAPGATFTDQAYVGDKPPVPYGTSTLAEARRQARKTLARSKSRETSQVLRVVAGTDRSSVMIVTRVSASVGTAGRTRHLCAIRRQRLVLHRAAPRSTGATDTYYPCPR